MVPSREQELWALAVWVEKHHGAVGSRFIAEKVGEASLESVQVGVVLWKAVAARFTKLSNRHVGKNEGAKSVSGEKTH